VQKQRRQASAKPASRALGIHDQQPPARLQHAGDLGQPLALQVVGQVVHHQAAEHYIKGSVGEGQRLDQPDLKIHHDALARRLGLRDGDHLGCGVDAGHNAAWASQRLGGQCDIAGATANL
jgi:hypothetical protein